MGKVRYGNCLILIMNKMKYFLYSIMLFCSCMVFTCCSNDILMPEQEMNSFDDLHFVVHVDNKASELTRAESGKNYWNIGDRIIMAIDNDDNNRCILEYKGNENWEVSKLDEQANFLNSQGSLCAIHADHLYIREDHIISDGDIVYTQNGSYVKKDNVVVINLDLNQRPVARIAITSIGSGYSSEYYLKGLQEYSYLTSLSSMNWMLKDEPEKLHYTDQVYRDTCVYYGLLKSNENGETKIQIADKKGIMYERTYHKQLKAGDYVIIHGPLSDEASLWSKHIFVHSISLMTNELNLIKGDSYVIDASIYNSNADNPKLIWESSNNNVATVSDNGVVTAHANGDAEIIVKSADGSAEATCNVHVKNIEDFILVKIGENNYLSMGGNYVSQKFKISIKNSYSKPIELVKRIGLGSNFVDVLTSLSNFTASFPKTELGPAEGVYVDIDLEFSKGFGLISGTGRGNQTWLSIEFSEKGKSKTYVVNSFFPWEYYIPNH